MREGHVPRESLDELAGRGRCDDLDVVGELDQLSDAVEVVVPDGDGCPSRLCCRVDRAQAASEDTSRKIDPIGVEECGDRDRAASLERLAQVEGDVVEEPHDDVFGRTFVIADPDGNLIRVSPV